MDPIHSREKPSCSAIDLAEMWRSSKISSWVWSIISGVVTLLDRPGRGASQVEKSLGLGRWLTIVCVPLMFLSEWREFPSVPCLAGKKKLDDSLRLDVVENARVAWHASFPRLQVATACFSCSPPDLNFLDPYFVFMYMHYNHWARATTHLQLNWLLLF